MRNLDSIHTSKTMATRYCNAICGQSQRSEGPLGRGPSHLPRSSGPWRYRQKERSTLSSIQRSWTPRPMHSMQIVQGIQQRKINRDCRTLETRGATAPFTCTYGTRHTQNHINKLGRRVAGSQGRRVMIEQARPQTFEQGRRVREPRASGRRDTTLY